MKRKIVSILLILSLLISLVACESGKTTDEVERKDVLEKSDDVAAMSENPFWVSQKPVTLTYHEMSATAWKDDTAVAQKLKEMTNVQLEGTISHNQTDMKQAYNLMIVSGELSDLVFYTVRDDILTHAEEGAFIPLNDLIKEHAPNIQRYIDENKELKQAITAIDGNIYYIPQIRDGVTAAGYFIREDWLDNLGLEVPTTVDDFYDVLKAFKEQDANKNGNPNDEIPFFARNKWVVQTRLAYLFDAHHDFYVDGDAVKFGPMETEFKTAMSELRKWYAEGLIDVEIFTRGGKSRDLMLNDNIGGVTHDWFGSTAGYNDSLGDVIDGFSFKAMLPPATSSGKVLEVTSRSTGYGAGTAISSMCEDPVIAIKFLDFCFSQEGRSLLNFGIEGEDYDLVNGKEILREHILTNENGALVALRERGAQLEMSFHQDFEYEKQWINPIALEGMEMYIEADCVLPTFPTLNYTLEEKAKISEVKGTIDTYINEKIQEWILGVSDVDDEFDKFVVQLKRFGVEELLQIQNDALKRQ